MRPGIPLLLLSIGLAGCLGPRRDAPPESRFAAPTEWRTTIERSLLLEAEWWKQFNDPTLSELVSRSLANNPDIGQAAARVEQARAMARFARAQLGPDVTFVGFGSYVNVPLPTKSFSAWLADPTAFASWDLDLFGRLKQESAAAKATLLSTEATRDAMVLSIATTTASAYITLLGYDERLAITRATLAAREQSLHIAFRQASTGYTSELEYRQADAEYRSTAAMLPQAELAVAKQEDALKVLLGENPGPVNRGMGIAALSAPGIPNELPAELLRRRPDIVAAEETLVAADHSLESRRRALLPNISLTGSYGELFARSLPSTEPAYLLGGTLLAPIFDSGRRHAMIDNATARRNEAAFAYRKAALSAFQGVEDALASVRYLNDQRTAAEAQVVSQKRTRDIAHKRFQDGYSTYLNELDAQRGLLSAQLSLAQAQTDWLTAHVSLYQAMGGGWSSENLDKTVSAKP